MAEFGTPWPGGILPAGRCSGVRSELWLRWESTCQRSHGPAWRDRGSLATSSDTGGAGCKPTISISGSRIAGAERAHGIPLRAGRSRGYPAGPETHCRVLESPGRTPRHVGVCATHRSQTGPRQPRNRLGRSRRLSAPHIDLRLERVDQIQLKRWRPIPIRIVESQDADSSDGIRNDSPPFTLPRLVHFVRNPIP